MCRYAFKNYKSHYVCFNCRKTFKQPLAIDQLERDGKLLRFRKLQQKEITVEEQNELDKLKETYFFGETKCPQCGAFMADLGRDFKAPPKRDLKKWAIIRSLYTIGHTFHTCGCTGPGYIPIDKSQYLDYLNKKLTMYEMQSQETQRMDITKFVDKNDRLSYWTKLINTIKQEMERYKNGA